MTEIDVDDLCCCEYVNVDGERAHLAATFCDCQAIDDVFDRTVRGCGVPDGLWQSALRALDERARLPCFGGAQHVGCSFFVACLLLPLALLSISVISNLAAVCLLLIGASFAVFTVRPLLRRIPQTKFFAYIALWSTVWLSATYSRYLAFRVNFARDGFFILLGIVDLYLIYRVRKTALEGRNVAKLSVQWTYCRICETPIFRKHHHCIWLSCCICEANLSSYRTLLATLATTVAFGLATALQNYSNFIRPCIFLGSAVFLCLLLLCVLTIFEVIGFWLRKSKS